jgi:hypothetical protein
MADFADYEWLTGGDAEKWLAGLAHDQRPTLQKLESLRRELSAQRARLVVEQAELRRRATVKFGDLAERMFFTPLGLEQSTDRWVAQYKATRLRAQTPSVTVHDYCCGIGGDLMALAAGGSSIGWDRSEAACLLASANVGLLNVTADVRTADVTALSPPPGATWHVDPDRRADGKRHTRAVDYSPSADVFARWRCASPDGAVKLAPAAEAPGDWLDDAELEWISQNRECRQAVAWFGRLASAPGVRRATRVLACRGDELRVDSLAGAAGVPLDYAQQPLDFLYDPDPAVLAGDLLGALAAEAGLASLGPGGAYLTGASRVDRPLLQSFRVLDCLPLRTAAVAAYLAERGVGQVEIKKRGVAVDPNQFWKQLRLRGNNHAVVVLTRIGKRQVALIAQRLPDPAGVNAAAPQG